MRLMPMFDREETAKLRCVEIDPRHLSLMDLEPGDCRYPYGGDEEGEAITFCGQPQRRGTSYAVSTIMTMVSSHMCVNATSPCTWPDVERIDRGLYRRYRQRGR